MSTEILNLSTVTNIVTQAAAKHNEIKETERRLAVASEQFAVKKYNKAGLKKLVAEVKARNVPLSQLEFAVNRGIVSISQTPTQNSAEIRAILEPLVTRDITQTDAEKTKKTEIAMLKNQAKAAGVPVAAFDNLVARAALAEQNKSFYVVKKEGYIFYVSSSDPGSPSGGSTPPQQETSTNPAPTQGSFIEENNLKACLIANDNFVRISTNFFTESYSDVPGIQVAFLLTGFSQEIRTKDKSWFDLMMKTNDISNGSVYTNEASVGYSFVYELTDQNGAFSTIKIPFKSSTLTGVVTNIFGNFPYPMTELDAHNGAVGVVEEIDMSEAFFSIFISGASGVGLLSSNSTITKVSLVVDSITGIYNNDMIPVVIGSPLVVAEDIKDIICNGTPNKPFPWNPTFPHQSAQLSVVSDTGDYSLSGKRVFEFCLELVFDDPVKKSSVLEDPYVCLEMNINGVTNKIPQSRMEITHNESNNSFVKFFFLVSLSYSDILSSCSDVGNGNLVFRALSASNLKNLALDWNPEYNKPCKYYRLGNANRMYLSPPNYIFPINEPTPV